MIQGQHTQPLRDEHAELRPQLEMLRAAADGVGSESRAVLGGRVSSCHSFLVEHLLVHAQAEEAALYPAVETALGCDGATETMRLDHAEIRRLTGELGLLRDTLLRSELDPAGENRLRQVLYGLYVLVMLHLQKEEAAYLPILDARLTPGQAADVFRRLHSAAEEAGRSGHR